MCIAKGDKAKTLYVIRYEAFEFLVITFGLTYALTMFCAFKNQLFNEYLDKFVIIYLDNILIYSQTLEGHVKHLRTIFKIFKGNTLFVKKEKCYFT